MIRRISLISLSLLALGQLIGLAGTSPVYKIEDVPLPPSKFGTQQVDGLTFLPDGRLVVCLPSGEIFFYDTEKKEWQLFAEGLHNPLGVIAISKSELIIAQRPELTRVRDTDGNGLADDFEVISDGFGMSGNYHEFHFTPVPSGDGGYFTSLGTGSKGNGVRTIVRGKFDPRGRDGRMHSSTPYRGCILMHTADGKTFPWAFGLRTPNGLGQDLDGNLFVTDNQGDWVGSSKLFHIKEGRFYGHAASLTWKPDFNGTPLEASPETLAKMRTRAAVVFPHGTMANSPTKVLPITAEAKLGPFTGQLLVGEMNQPRIMRVMLEEVGGELQGACVPFIDQAPLRGGCNRFGWAPDGSLYVGQTKHTWAGSQGIQRISWNGKTPFEIQNMQLTENGFRFTFTEPVNRKIASKKETWPFKRYYFYYQESYGSPRVDEVPVDIKSIKVSPDAKTVEVQLAELKAWHIHEVEIQKLASASGTDLANGYIAYTLNRLLKNTPPEPAQLGPVRKEKPIAEPVPVNDPKGTVYEAEDAKREGPAISSSHEGFTGQGYADFRTGEEWIEWQVKSPKAGKAELYFRYAIGSGARPLHLVVNEKELEKLPFEGTGSWSKFKFQKASVDLKKGSNSIMLLLKSGPGGNIDHLQVVEPK